MITVNFSRYVRQPDSLVAAREAIFEAMFERTGDQLELGVHSDTDHSYMDVYFAELNTNLVLQLLEFLGQVELLDHLTVDVSTDEERDARSVYA